MNYTVEQIGTVHSGAAGCSIELAPAYRAALAGLEGFSHVQVIWWFDGCDDLCSRAVRILSKPYVKGPDAIGVFATRSPQRPNPIAVTTAYVTFLDPENGIIGLAWIDANDGSPVLDIKPYTPSADRVEDPAVPDWCAGWPTDVESSGDFDWAAEFNF